MSVSVSSRLPAIIAGMEPKAAMVVAKAVSDVEAHAKSGAPVDTGYLRGTIQGESSGLSGVVNAGADYAIYQEFGTRFQSGSPFMTPAAEQVRPSFQAAMRQIVQ